MISVGIDLGTTNSLIAVFLENGEIEFIENESGKLLTPSAVGLSDKNEIITGAAAKHRILQHPDITFTKFKRSMGSSNTFKLGKKNLTATDLSAFLLKQLVANLRKKYSEGISEAVISVPAYFNSIQRQETQLAAEMAGLQVSRLVNEPTAAALAYGLQDLENESQFIVLDLGGGTFDVSILEMFEGVMEVRASSGDAFLGGEDFTQAVAEYFAEKNGLEWKKLSSSAREALYAAAEEMKKTLSTAAAAESTVPVEGEELNLSLTLSDFEEICSPLSLRMRKPIEKCLHDAKLSTHDMDRVILVGGATRMPLVRSLAARIFQKLPERTLDPDLVIAQGAAVQAALCQKNEALDDVVMTDVSPFSLGIRARNETRFGAVEDAFFPIIERNTTLPASRTQWFQTLQDNQTKLLVQVYQGESPIATENVKLGEITVDVPAKPAGHEAIDVRFSYDVSGLLQVEVTVLSTERVYEIIIEGSAKSLSKSELKARLKALESYKIHPREDLENQEVLENLKHLYAMHLGEDRVRINELIGLFEAALNTQDPKEIRRVRTTVIEQIEIFEKNYVR